MSKHEPYKGKTLSCLVGHATNLLNEQLVIQKYFCCLVPDLMEKSAELISIFIGHMFNLGAKITINMCICIVVLYYYVYIYSCSNNGKGYMFYVWQSLADVTFY